MPGSHTRLLLSILVVMASGSLAAQRGSGGQSAPVTFNRDIAPILSEHCWTCHSPGGAGPFSLVDYQDVRRRAAQIADVTRARIMPPWKPVRGYGQFVGERRLTDEQIQLIQRWRDEGAPEGHRTSEGPIVPRRDNWQLGRPDLVVQLPQPYSLRASGPDILRNFVIPLPTGVRRYVKGLEFLPGSSNVVHHATMRIDSTKASQQLDESDPQSGYEGILASTARYPEGHFLAWTPGQLRPLSEDSAWVLQPDSSLVVQLHLRSTGKPELVAPSIGVYFTETPPSRVPFMIRLSRQHIDIPAGEDHYVVEDRYVLPVDVELSEVQPHAHYLAREVDGVARLPDGSSRWIISIKDWDFNWQDVYRLVEPMHLPKGTELSMRYVFDNSERNVRNPSHPPRRVTWGQESSDEMADLWLQVFPRSQQDRGLLERDVGQKMIREDLVGFRRLLTDEPDNPRYHEAVAYSYVQTGQHVEALDHFQTSVRLDPGSAYARYNLGTAFIVIGRLNDAAAAFTEALRLQPSLVSARNNLAGVLWNLGRREEAVNQYREVLRLEPQRGLTHRDLAAALLALDRPREALEHFAKAAAILPDHVGLLQEVGWILAAHPDENVRAPQHAIQLADRAAGLTSRRDPRVLDLLAVGYAAASRFDEAVSIARSAAALAAAAGSHELAQEIRSRLQLYEEGKPYRLGERATIRLDGR